MPVTNRKMSTKQIQPQLQDYYPVNSVAVYNGSYKELLPTNDRIKIKTFNLSGEDIEIYVFRDESSFLLPVYKLWYEVYIDELKYPKTIFSDDRDRALRCNISGSYIFAAFYHRECIGTIRITHEDAGLHEFDYSKSLRGRPIIEVTKFIISKKYRKTALKGVLMSETQRFGIELYEKYFICINSGERLLPFYRTMDFFFVEKEPVIHPEIGNISYLLAVRSEVFTRICRELEMLNSGNIVCRFKWSLKYFYFKKLAKYRK